MTTKAQWLALADKIEALAGPDRIIDIEIECALSSGHRAIKPSKATTGKIIETYSNGATGTRWAREFTGSIDAAVSAMPAGAMWRVGHDEDDPGQFRAEIVYPPCADSVIVNGALPATALLAAICRARAAMIEGG